MIEGLKEVEMGGESLLFETVIAVNNDSLSLNSPNRTERILVKVNMIDGNLLLNSGIVSKYPYRRWIDNLISCEDEN